MELICEQRNFKDNYGIEFVDPTTIQKLNKFRPPKKSI